MARIIEVLAYPAVQLLDVTGPLQVFATANDQVTQAGGVAPYELRVMAKAGKGDGVMASAGLGIATRPLSRIGTSVDTLLIAGGPGVEAASTDPELVAWVRQRAKKARRVASVCTGAFLLAASGALDGRRAATHWSVCTEFARRYPAVKVESDPIFVRDGSVWTSAGVTAGIDLALALVEDDLGHDIALSIARWLVVFVRRTGSQAQLSTHLSAQAAARRPLREVQQLIDSQPGADLSVPRLARLANLSPRQFARAFQAEFGMPPGRYVDRVRLETACRMLEGTVEGIEQIARACGYGTPETMRRAFLRGLQEPPAEYRRRVLRVA